MPVIDELTMTARVAEILNRQPAVGFALGVVRDGALEFFYPHGVADVATRRPIAEDTIFRIASITKTFTAIAVMQLWEQGLVDLDAPANDYLRAYQLVPAKAHWRPATLRDLLTHTAGVGEQVPRFGFLRPDFGESVKIGRRVPSLAEYYRGGLRLDAQPGTRFRYGNHSPATLGQVVEDVSGKPLGHYLREQVFEPLGMADTTLVRSEVDPARRAAGYVLRSSGARAVADRDWVTVGAAGTYSTPSDMARYLTTLLGGGTNKRGTVLKPATLASMFAAQFQPHPRIPGMGLAFWRRNAGGHPVVEHQGVIPGFNSQIVVAPDDGVAVMAFTNGTRDGTRWLPVELSRLVNGLLGVPDDEVRTDVPHRPEIWDDLCGWYYLPGPVTEVRIRTFSGAGVEVFVRRGRPFLRFLTPLPALYRGFPLHPADDTDPYAFDLDFSDLGLGTFPVVFSRDRETGTMAVHFEVMPLSAHMRSEKTNPRRWVTGIGALAATGILARRMSSTRRRRAAP
jgi:CubicO group peptidase (beta-lactamase class C family)